MNTASLKTAGLLAGLLALGWACAFGQTPQAPAPAVPPASAAMTTPTMSFPFTANPNPTKFDVGPLGNWYVTGAVSALAFSQDKPFAGDARNRTDISNAQVFVQKTDGIVQFFAEAGAYSLPDLGLPYIRSGDSLNDFFGPLPVAFVKLVPDDKFSVQIGKLPTLIGAETTFDFEDTNIERGLLWNQENAVNRGIQANYTSGPLAVSLAWTDGFYSNRYNWLIGSITYTLNSSSILTFVTGDSTRRTTVNTIAAPMLLNNEQLHNLIYTYTNGPWTIQPYLQYSHVPSSATIGTTKEASVSGAAILASYAFDSKSALAGFSLPFRVEWIKSSGNATDGSPNLLYGPGSKAWSFTLTPTYQYKVFFARTEFSYVQASGITRGLAFGSAGANRYQARVMLETGVLF